MEDGALGIGASAGRGPRLIPEIMASTCARVGCGGVGMVMAGRGDSGAGGANGDRVGGGAAAGAGALKGAADRVDAIGAGGDAGAVAEWGGAAEKSSSILPRSPMAMTPPHTEQRARTPASGIFPGSTRNTDPHSGHATFIAQPLSSC
jgi:hypothetical protein